MKGNGGEISCCVAFCTKATCAVGSSNSREVFQCAATAEMASNMNPWCHLQLHCIAYQRRWCQLVEGWYSNDIPLHILALFCGGGLKGCAGKRHPMSAAQHLEGQCYPKGHRVYPGIQTTLARKPVSRWTLCPWGQVYHHSWILNPCIRSHAQMLDWFALKWSGAVQ